jgi:hypothetical protein
MWSDYRRSLERSGCPLSFWRVHVDEVRMLGVGILGRRKPDERHSLIIIKTGA